MAYAVREEDAEEAARIEKALVTWLGGRITALRALQLPPASAEAKFIERMDLQLNVFHRAADKNDVRMIKRLCWNYRRQMPAPSRPKLPPDDPVVREMEARGE